MSQFDYSGIAASLTEAKIGDTVLLYDMDRNAYNSAGEYTGRGAWSIAKIDSETRVSFVIGHEKFDRKSGYVRTTGGYMPRRKIAGLAEYEIDKWQSARRKLSRMVECCDYDTLRKVALALGIASVSDLP